MLVITILSFLYLALPARSATGQATNFNISTVELQSYGCNVSCQAILSESNVADLEISGTEFDFDFYSTANNFSSSAPGDLLKVQPVDSSVLKIPDGIATFRFQYTSIDLDGTIVPSSGFIAFPFASPAYGSQFPLIAFAHGTIGVHRGCAPSSSPSLYDYNSWVPLMYNGYAVVATDYAGLGNNYTLHKYTAFTAHANDVFYSVQAARKAFPGVFTKDWASVGHSQGGGAVWKLSEHPLVQSHTSGYLGTVAISPASKVFDMAVETFERIIPRPDFHQFVVTAELGQVVYGLKAFFPNYTSPWFAYEMRRRVELANMMQSCTFSFMGLSLDLPRDQFAAANGTPATDELFKIFQDMNAPAQGDPASRPILIIQGWNDTSVLPQNTLESFQATVNAGNVAYLMRYPGLDHSATIAASTPLWLKYLDELFAHKKQPRTSSDTTIVPFNLDVAKAPSELPLSEQPLLSLLG
ncbi:hypothetical protein SS1G_05612 [Sclerotinia sclerotiorum 1980 UF-70]|uniref:Peptidase S9 prolyl oligopeptidase catalytic domain-containing protein n=2 Tax=Sclerotinia sclerotiorum (strain ATCC 18683 / 1980 / Ss-1) TaxID=665079 RepID=A7EJW7_SCLS1|nr:hypothetical protein SS1G_05612 [Sclerotinia sclerotiorum 1980 UF-70]APA10087.1 hypothetical protein sscle_05g048570 [Sclerotinia sclerotiorum 1980 UF-70]EDO03133.1 hypothetical protein SS1G_05612 [Sclerotinia sclerotiorum 1980 UF-70]